MRKRLEELAAKIRVFLLEVAVHSGFPISGVEIEAGM
jgi:hypothetical protein